MTTKPIKIASLFIAWLAVLLLFPILTAQAAATWTPRYIGTTVNGQTAPSGYYEYLPSSYNSASPLSTYPVVIFMHGSGQWGNGSATGSPNLSNILGAGVPQFIQNNTSPLAQSGGLFDTNNVIVLCPQCANSVPMLDNVWRNFFNFALAAYPKIDKRRIWFTGLSYGSTTVTTAIDNSVDPSPDDPAAVVACAWRGDEFNTTAIASIAKVVPFWGLTSQGDFWDSSNPDFLCSAANKMAAAISGGSPANVYTLWLGLPNYTTTVYTANFNGSSWTWVSGVDPITGVNPKVTGFTGSDHNSWDRTYGNTNVWNWMFQQQKPDVSITSPTSGSSVAQGSNVTFTGTATDKNGTSLSGSSLIWTDSINGTLGTGTSISTSSLSVGSHVVKLQATDNSYRDNKTTINLTVTSTGAPSFTDGPPTSTATVGTSYSFTYTASGSPTPTFTLNSGTLPPGLSLASNGVLSGTPTTSGVYSGITVKASNSNGNATTSAFTITVNQAPSITNGPPPSTVTVNTSYSFSYTATGYPTPTFTLASGTLPTGITLSSSGVLSGTPTVTGTYSGLSVRAANSVSSTTTSTFTITVQASSSAPTITSSAPPGGTMSVSYSFTYTATGSPAPTFSVTAGSLPTGLSLSSAGVISGTPSATGTFSGTVTATNGVSPNATQNFNITIASNSGGSTVLAIDCGSTSSYTASDGTVYMADTYVSGGGSFTATTTASGPDPSLYQIYRYGTSTFTYTIPLANGNYVVHLKYAEMSQYQTVGARVFNVAIQGTTVATNFDITAIAGTLTPLDEAYSATVTSGTLTITQTSVVANSELAAIVIKTAAPTTVVAIDCGSTSSYTASDGTVYSADTYVSGGGSFTATTTASGPDPSLYQLYRYGTSSFTYTIPLANGSYTVHLKYAEMNQYQTVGARVFNVAIQGTTVATNFDITAIAGTLTPLDEAYSATVTGGTLTITQTSVVANSELAAILITSP